MSGGSGFASASLPRHLARGVVGIGSLAAAVVLLPVVGLFALLALPIAFVALRGCPTCWAIGLIETISNGRAKRVCDGETCRLVRADGLDRAA